MRYTFDDVKSQLLNLTEVVVRGIERPEDDPTMIPEYTVGEKFSRVDRGLFGLAPYAFTKKDKGYGKVDYDSRMMLIVVDRDGAVYALPLPSKNGIPPTLYEILKDGGYENEIVPFTPTFVSTLCSKDNDGLKFVDYTLREKWEEAERNAAAILEESQAIEAKVLAAREDGLDYVLPIDLSKPLGERQSGATREERWATSTYLQKAYGDALEEDNRRKSGVTKEKSKIDIV